MTRPERTGSFLNRTSKALTAKLERASLALSVVQSFTLVVATIMGGTWTWQQFFVDGKNLSIPNISLTAKASTAAANLIIADITISGSDKRGYHYDLSKASLSATRIVGWHENGVPKQERIARLPVVITDVAEDGSVRDVAVYRAHISSSRSTHYAIPVPVPGPGVYNLTFTMPHAGVLDGKGVDVEMLEGTRKSDVTAGEAQTFIVEVPASPDLQSG